MNIIKAKYEILNKDQLNGKEILQKIETIGRTCYKSEDKITEDSSERFVKNLILREHEAMLEFVDITVKFYCDRGLSHEIVRHRHSSFAQESTRYCNYAADKFGNEVSFIDIRRGIELDSKTKNLNEFTITAIISEWLEACYDAEKHYFAMLELGASPQIARSALNNSAKTEINVKMNLREWRHFFKLRCDVAAHPQMRELTIPLLQDMHEICPVVFEDIVEWVINRNIKASCWNSEADLKPAD